MVVAPSVQNPVLRGRARAQAAIAALLRGAASGAGGALVVEGGPGTGRTALLRHAARQAAAFTRIRLDGLLGEEGLPLAALHRLGLRPPGRAPRTAEQRLALCAWVCDALAAMSRERPVLCAVDDAEWLDRPSLDALAFAARRASRLPLAMIFAGTAGPAVGDGVLHLDPLDPAAARAVLADHGVRDDAAAPLLALAAGNPAALVDLARATGPGRPPPRSLPADGALRRAYRLRLRTLPPSTRRVLLVAALDTGVDAGLLARLGAAALAPAERSGLLRVGAGFPHPVVREVIRDDATLAERQRAHRTLARVRTGLPRLLHVAAVTAPPAGRLADEIERAVGAGTGCALAAEALARAAELTVDPARAAARRAAAARYAWLAGDPTPALAGVDPLLDGDMALRAGRAAAALDRFLAAADTLAGTEPALAWRALVRAGEAVCQDGDHARYAEVLRRAATLRRAGRVDPLPAAYVAGLASVLRGDHAIAAPPLRAVLAASGTADAGPGAATADREAGTRAAVAGAGDADTALAAAAAALLLADDAAAHRAVERAVAAARSVGAVALLPRAMELRTFTDYWTGCYAAAAASAAEGLAWARACGQPAAAGNLAGWLALLRALRGDRAGCLRWTRELRAAPPAGRPRALVSWALAVLDLLAGRCDDALGRLSTMADPSTGSGNVLVQMTAAPYLVEAAAGAGTPAVAVPAAAAFVRWADATADPTRRALAARCRALLLPRGSTAALAELERALALHPPAAGEFERARTALLLGRELRRARRPRDARPHLHRAAEDFAVADMPAWSATAAAELRAAGDSCDPAPPPAAPLTAQQRRVAELVAAGATNREVAARLYLSTRTVDHHLRNIYTRLGVRSRTELARTL